MPSQAAARDRPFGDKKIRIFLIFEKKTKNENFETLMGAEKIERGDPLGFLKLQFAAKKIKKLEGGPFGDKKKSKKKSHSVEKKFEEGTLRSRPVLYLPLKI